MIRRQSTKSKGHKKADSFESALVRETGRVLLRNPHGLLHHPMQLRHARLKTVRRTVLLTATALLGFKSLTISRTIKNRTLNECPVWCEKRDLNPYGVNHTPLKRARLPVPPLSHIILRRSARDIVYHKGLILSITFLKNIEFFILFSKNKGRNLFRPLALIINRPFLRSCTP